MSQVKLLEWIEHARQLERELARAEEDRDWWIEQSNFWSGQLQSVVAMWIAADQPKSELIEEEVENPFG